MTELSRNYVARGQRGITKKDTTSFGAGPAGRSVHFRKEKGSNNLLQEGTGLPMKKQ